MTLSLVPGVPASTFALIEESRRAPWWRRIFGSTRRLLERPDWRDYVGVDWGDQILQTHLTDDFHAKQGRSTGRWVLRHAGRDLAVYLKRHYRLPWWQGLVAMLWPGGDWSPALRELRHLEWARAQGLPVPRVVAAGEYLRPFGRLQSFLAVEELTGMLALHQAIPEAARHLPPLTFRRWKAGLAREMARLTRFLHDRHYFHKDLYLCHFYVPLADTRAVPVWPGRVHMIDFHRLGHHPWTSPWWRIKDLGQLLYSSAIEGVDARDRLRFWRCYLGPSRRPRSRWLTWCVRRRGARYEQHNAKKLARGPAPAPAQEGMRS
jgi:heptose I phosphotransferase